MASTGRPHKEQAELSRPPKLDLSQLSDTELMERLKDGDHDAHRPSH